MKPFWSEVEWLQRNMVAAGRKRVEYDRGAALKMENQGPPLRRAVPYRQDIVPSDMQGIYEKLHYSPAVRVGNILHVSGQVGRDENLQVVPAGPPGGPPTEEGMERQITQAFENMKKLLRTAGADFADVFHLESWFTDMPSQLGSFVRVKDQYFVGPTYPTWTGFGVHHFSHPEIICEIKCTAILRNFPPS